MHNLFDGICTQHTKHRKCNNVGQQFLLLPNQIFMKYSQIRNKTLNYATRQSNPNDFHIFSAPPGCFHAFYYKTLEISEKPYDYNANQTNFATHATTIHYY